MTLGKIEQLIPIFLFSPVKAKIALGKVKQVRKTLFRAVKIGERSQNGVGPQLHGTEGNGGWREGVEGDCRPSVFADWLYLKEK